MNAEQFQLLENHNLTTDMVIALASLVDGKKSRHQNRSYKALYRRGLVTKDCLVTQQGSNLYDQFCSLGKSIPEYMKEVDEKVRDQMKSNKAEIAAFTGILNDLQIASSQIDVCDQDLRAVITSWPSLPLEFRVLVADAARRVANTGNQKHGHM